MPLTRYQLRNEYSLADPELYKAADRDDPEALLEGVAMAGLVGVLRQLGDLAEFAAEIFHDLHEEVMVTAARGHGLMARVQQLEAEFPPIEKAFLSQTNHTSFFCNGGVDWHPNLHVEQNLITRGDLPRCVMDSYEECRGPPRLFLLDKFDVAGAGACLKRYTDPSLFKVDAGEVHREKKSRKTKKKGSRWRNGETPEIVPTSKAKLHQLFLEERVEKGHSDPARLVKLKKRPLNASQFDSRSGKSYMEKFLEASAERDVVREISVNPLPLKWTPDNCSESRLEILEISTVGPVKKSSRERESTRASPNEQEVVLKPSMDELYGVVIDRQIVTVPESTANGEADEIPSDLHKVMLEMEMAVGGEGKAEGSVDGDHSDGMTSEVDNYVDALATMESETETDNENRHKTDLGFSNVGKYGTDSDRNEEQLEFEAHFSDSQSIGNFSASDDGNSSFKRGRSSFSYSDTTSNLAENTPPDGEGAAKVFSSETSVAEVKEMPINELHEYIEIHGTKSLDLGLPNDMCIDKDNISNLGESSCNSSFMDSNPTLLPLDSAASSLQYKLDETPSECMKPGSELSNIDKSETSLVDSSVVSDVPLQIRDDALSTVCAESHPLDKLDGGDPNISSDTLLHLSNNSYDSANEVLQTDFRNEICADNMVDGKIGSPQSITSPREEEFPCSALPEVDVYSGFTPLPESSGVVKHNDFISEVDDAFPATGFSPESSSSMVDTSQQICSFEEQQLSDVDAVSQVELDTTEKTALYSAEEGNLEDISRTADGEKASVLTCKVAAVEGDDVPLELPTNFQDCSILENHLALNDVIAESIQAPNVAVSTAASANDDVPADANANSDVNDVVCPPPNSICPPSGNHVNLQESSSGIEDLHQEALVLDEPFSPEYIRGSEAEMEANQLEVAPKDPFLPMSCKLISRDDSNSEMVNGVHDSPASDQELEFLPMSCKLISRDDSNSEMVNGVHDSTASDQELESKHLDQCPLSEDGEDAASSPTSHLPDLETQQSLELQADQLDVESMKVAEARSISLNHLTEPTQSLDHIDQERCFNDTSYSCEDLPSQPSLFEYLPQSNGQEINSSKQAMDPLGSLLPTFSLLHEATQVGLEEMPPLPPLPPMQWRLGKIQHDPPVSHREFIEHSQEPFPSIPPFRDDEKAGCPDQQRGMVQSGNPFLPPSAVDVEKSHLVSEQVVGNATQPTLSSLQLPTTVNYANGQQNSLALEGTQFLNPFLTSSALPNETPEHSFLASEDKEAQSSSNPFLPEPVVECLDSRHGPTDSSQVPVSSEGKLVHPLNQIAPETGLEDKAFQHSSQNREGEHGNPSDTSVLPPRMVAEQPHHGLLTSEGQSAWLSYPFTILPSPEVGNTNVSSIVKIPRPRNPLIDAVAALDKSKLRKVTERVQPQSGAKEDERDSLLEQIRAKSFNLKPAVVSRPSIQGPKTNLKVAAILEKAIAIRQATAGSDEDDDEDWSDS